MHLLIHRPTFLLLSAAINSSCNFCTLSSFRQSGRQRSVRAAQHSSKVHVNDLYVYSVLLAGFSYVRGLSPCLCNWGHLALRYPIVCGGQSRSRECDWVYREGSRKYVIREFALKYTNSVLWSFNSFRRKDWNSDSSANLCSSMSCHLYRKGVQPCILYMAIHT